MKRLLITAALATLAVGCSDADVASANISKAADQFEVSPYRYRVVFKPAALVPDIEVRK